MLAKLAAGATGYDLLVPTGNAVETLLRQHALRELDKRQLPNLANLKAAFRQPWYDPEMRYAVPYATTVTLLGYNARRLAELGLPTDTWALIFEPRYLEKLKGKVTVLNSQRELMAAAMKYLGYSVQETDPARWDEAKRLILRAKPYWAAFSNSTYIKDLAIGNIWVAHGYSSDMYRAQQDALEAKRPFSIDFRTAEGRRGAGGRQLRPAQGWQAPGSGTPLHRLHPRRRQRRRCLEPDRRRQPERRRDAAHPFPRLPAIPASSRHPDDLRRLEMLRDFDPKTRRLLSRMWTEIKAVYQRDTDRDHHQRWQ